MKPGDLFIVTRVSDVRARLCRIKRGDQAIFVRAGSELGVVLVKIHDWQFWWALSDLLRISI